MTMETSSFNLEQTAAALQKRWKNILIFTVACVAIATVTVFVVPPYFRSAATVVSGNSALADKGRIFNPNIKDLYSYFGSGDDLDRIQGIADRQLTYLQLVDEFSLIDYYGLKGDSIAILRKKASLCLQKNISLKKTEEGQLQITAWTKDKNLSAALVNRLVSIVQETATEIWQKNYTAQITKFDSTIGVMQKDYVNTSDSIKGAPEKMENALKLKQLQNRMEDFGKIADEFKLASQSLPAVLYVIEPASPAPYAERPDKKAVIIIAALAGLIFGCMVVLVNDRKTTA
jgi:capsular polysaccharide biosynthesis protein